MKKISLLLILVFFVTAIFTGCSMEESPTQAVQNACGAIKAADVETAVKYINYDELLKANNTNAEISNEDTKQLMKKIFSGLEYKVKSSQIDGDKATVTTEITNIDMSYILPDFISRVFPLVFSGLNKEQLNEKYMDIFTELLSRKDNKTTTKTVEIPLTKVEGKWKITITDDFTDAITGGMLTAAKNMSSAFGGNSETKN